MKRTAGNEVLRHGYRMDDIHSLVRMAVHVAGPLASEWHERYDTAWSAVAEYLYAAQDPPTANDLIRTGRLAIYAEITAERQCYGYYKAHNAGAQYGVASSPAFRMYWWDLIAGRVPSHEGHIVDRMSLTQILPTLTPRQRDALLALAVHGDYQAAADALGLSATAFKTLISRGRDRFRLWWHEGEIPSRCWGTDRRAGVRAGERRRGGTAMDAIRRRHKGALAHEQ